MKDHFEIENFLDREDYITIEKNATKKESFVDPNGVFKGTEVSKQQWFDESSDLGKMIIHKVAGVEDLHNNIIDGMQVCDMIRPYDVHSDYLVQKNQKPISDPKVHDPSYTIIIPLVDGEYHTVIFDQEADYNNFSTYKENNNKLDNYVSDEDWQKYCNHCHKIDQKYLTIKKVFHWRKGTLLAINRRLFHASANFEQPKRALVIWSSR